MSSMQSKNKSKVFNEPIHDYNHAFCMGVASGSASAFSENLATKEEIEKVYKTIVLEEKV